MDNMTAKVSCFARAYHYNNNSIRIFTDDIAEKLLGEDYNQIAKSMSDGIDFFCPGFEGTREEGLGISDEGLGGKDYEGISLEEDYIFCGLPNRIPVGRYHSWVVDTKDFPEALAITAISPEGQIMALKHREYDIHGIQFHPESVLTPDGKTIVKNWLFK